LVKRRWHSNTLNVLSFKGADYDTDHYLKAAKVCDRMAVNKKGTENFDLEKLNLRKLNKLEVRKKYQIKISNRFAALENFSYGEDINRAWENIKESIKTSAQQSIGLY
jgi:hypothetical protein